MMMNPIIISRILMFLLLVNEVFVVLRTPAEEREHIALPPLPWLLILLFVPFFYALELPIWLAAIAIFLQAFGLFMEIFSEIQLSRAKSFGVLSNKGTEPQTTGFYRWFEHPIYIGILLQVIGWSLFMPIVVIALGLMFIGVRQMVQNEREYLAESLDFKHTGIDTPLWN
jgi:protein-S-isoprenylcysteine O-methyltransferase Ste14